MENIYFTFRDLRGLSILLLCGKERQSILNESPKKLFLEQNDWSNSTDVVEKALIIVYEWREGDLVPMDPSIYKFTLINTA